MFRDLMKRVRSLYQRHDLDMTWITPEWAVGAAPSPTQLAAYAHGGIGSILDLRAEAYPEPATFAAHDVHLRHLPTLDRAAPTIEDLVIGTEWALSEMTAGRRVLICCQAGSGRSVTMACALLVVMGYPLAETFSLIAKRRTIARPTDAQLLALRSFSDARSVLPDMGKYTSR